MRVNKGKADVKLKKQIIVANQLMEMLEKVALILKIVLIFSISFSIQSNRVELGIFLCPLQCRKQTTASGSVP